MSQDILGCRKFWIRPDNVDRSRKALAGKPEITTDSFKLLRHVSNDGAKAFLGPAKESFINIPVDLL